MKRILFVDDEQAILDGLRNVLRPERSRWSMRFAACGAEALQLLDRESADVVVTDMRMPQMDGLAFLARVQQLHPKAARIVLSGYADLAAVAQASAAAHQYLLKPCDPETLRGVIERTCELQDLLASETLQRAVGTLGSLPSAPRVYGALTRALEDPDVGVKQLAAIVKSDVAMSTRVLQFVNSAYYGLAQRVVSIESAIVYVGINTLRHLALTLEVFGAFAPGAGLDVDQLERHALLVARIARRIASEPCRSDVAFAAGLLHDAGKLVLLNRQPAAFEEALRRAASAKVPLHVAEREVLGATHAEVGGYLLGLWGLPHAIVEAVAFHHHDERLTRGVQDLVVAIGAANLLAHAVAPELSTGRPATDAQVDRMKELMLAWREVASREAANLHVE